MKGENKLQFRVLRAANRLRIPQFRDRQGRLCHSHPTGADWSPSQWLQAVVGELGELANILKKIDRGDMTLEEARNEVEKEFADVLIYFDIFALQFRIDLGRAITEKFNEVSKRVGATVFIGDSGEDYYVQPATCTDCHIAIPKPGPHDPYLCDTCFIARARAE